MSDFDLDRLGDVWRQQPDPAEMERAAAHRRSRCAAARALGRDHRHLRGAGRRGVVIFLVLQSQAQTFVMGSAAILVLLGSNFRQRRLRQVELSSLTGTTEEMLDQSIARVETDARLQSLHA